MRHHASTRATSVGLLAALLCLLATPALAGSITSVTGESESHTNMQPSLALTPLIHVNSTTATPAGEITFFAGNYAPGGWMLAQGQLLPIVDYIDLFSQIGTIYGGDGRTTFALPDLRDRATVGAGSSPGTSYRTLGGEFGSSATVLGVDQLPAHDHTTPDGLTGLAGGGQMFGNMQPSLVLNYGVMPTGIYPSLSSGVDTPYLGQIRLTAGYLLPAGALLADGRLLDIASNSALFSLLGTLYGGDGRTTFALPDLGGRTPVGFGQGAGLPLWLLGQTGGLENSYLSLSNLAEHGHTLLPTSTDSGLTGGSAAYDNTQPSLGLNYIIALEGVYPSRTGGNPDSFLGQIELFAGNFAPRGWAFADGRLLPISSNTALFSLLGTTYGGDGRTTFALPDLRGRAIIGAGYDTWLGSFTGEAFSTMTIAEMGAHAHDLEFGSVPEPTTLSLALIGLAGLGAIGLRRRDRRTRG